MLRVILFSQGLAGKVQVRATGFIIPAWDNASKRESLTKIMLKPVQKDVVSNPTAMPEASPSPISRAKEIESSSSYLGQAIRRPGGNRRLSLRGPSSDIKIRGARQNNLKNLSLDIPTNELIVVTGVSGSGKSSLVFDTLYAEGQRRYVETFSAYARQFLDRMDKPQVDRIEGVPPAIAIDQTNPVRTSRSTVGTMTELNDHLKLLYARVATLHCRKCQQAVSRETVASIHDKLREKVAAIKAGEPRVHVCFTVSVPANFKEEEIESHAHRQR